VPDRRVFTPASIVIVCLQLRGAAVGDGQQPACVGGHVPHAGHCNGDNGGQAPGVARLCAPRHRGELPHRTFAHHAKLPHCRVAGCEKCGRHTAFQATHAPGRLTPEARSCSRPQYLQPFMRLHCDAFATQQQAATLTLSHCATSGEIYIWRNLRTSGESFVWICYRLCRASPRRTCLSGARWQTRWRGRPSLPSRRSWRLCRRCRNWRSECDTAGTAWSRV